MDRVPIAFLEHLYAISTIFGLSQAKELSGQFGKLARHTFEQWTCYVCSVQDGRVGSTSYRQFIRSDQEDVTPEEIAAVPKKFVREIWIFVEDAEVENVSRRLVRQFPHAEQSFVLDTSTINKAWVDFACSLNMLQRVMIKHKLDDDSLRLFQKLITGRKLFALVMPPEVCEGAIMELPKSLLCQDQFTVLQIEDSIGGAWRTAPLQEVLEFWTENSDRLRGKNLLINVYSIDMNCKSGVKQLEKFLLNRASAMGHPPGVASRTRRCLTIQSVLKVCSKEECDFIERNYQHVRNYCQPFYKPSCVYKYEEGEEEEKRRLYISFECGKEIQPCEKWRRASHEGHKDLSLMHNISLLHIMFA
uniref:FBA_2 domain-containing protein n=1 Tax=Steinernema glaseri TaxID=37863 RepID=A0A1I8AMP3_9BILA